MTSQLPTIRAFSVIAAALVVCGVLMPTPARGATVSLIPSVTSAAATSLVRFLSNSHDSAGQAVQLQRRLGGGSWRTIATGTMSSSSTSTLSIRVALGTYSYRSVVAGVASNATSVSGAYSRNLSVPGSGAPFTLYGQLPMAKARRVQVQYLSGSTWTNRGSASSTSAGFAGVRTYLASTAKVRFYAPKTSTLPAWTAPPGLVTIGTDPVIKRIIDDTNADRASHGVPALKVHPSLNTVAGNWAYKMYVTSDPGNCRGSFFHNVKPRSTTNYWDQYPPRWLKAGENIAAGQSYTQVVSGWIASAAHHNNIKNPAFTHIGVGYFDAGSGGKCYKRYYVQNFARY